MLMSMPYTMKTQAVTGTVKMWVNQAPPPEVARLFAQQGIAVREQHQQRKDAGRNPQRPGSPPTRTCAFSNFAIEKHGGRRRS